MSSLDWLANSFSSLMSVFGKGVGPKACKSDECISLCIRFFNQNPFYFFIYHLFQQDKIYNTTYHPQYHTHHDTIYWLENFVDKEYKIHLTVAKAGLLYLLQLSDTPVVPFTMKRYDDVIKRGIDVLTGSMTKSNIDDDTAKERM